MRRAEIGADVYLLVGECDIETAIGRIDEDGAGLARGVSDYQADRVPGRSFGRRRPDLDRVDECHVDRHEFRICRGNRRPKQQAYEG